MLTLGVGVSSHTRLNQKQLKLNDYTDVNLIQDQNHTTDN